MTPIWQQIDGWYAVRYHIALTSGNLGHTIIVSADSEAEAEADVRARWHTVRHVTGPVDLTIDAVRPIAQGIIPDFPEPT